MVRIHLPCGEFFIANSGVKVTRIHPFSGVFFTSFQASGKGLFLAASGEISQQPVPHIATILRRYIFSVAALACGAPDGIQGIKHRGLLRRLIPPQTFHEKRRGNAGMAAPLPSGQRASRSFPAASCPAFTGGGLPLSGNTDPLKNAFFPPSFFAIGVRLKITTNLHF